MFGRKQLLIAAVGAFALLGWGAPQKARASCGDYVMPTGQGHDQGSRPHAQPHSTNPQEQPTPIDRSPRKPCSGPTCSQHQDLPPAPPAPPAPTTQKLWVGSFDLVLLQDHHIRYFLEETRCRLAQGADLDIFHPPRSL